ncbi:hypothetical protein PRZ48_000165 [Zasmidium cellare]|uniref:Uncharacterized protein n=1 Tax=Zasmidium cellare TaxID=395010 RepID=A0ABR0EYZ4_ZASCE|nr:hypothetical protein PRZ48_000165 [Zasmidium cellare]
MATSDGFYDDTYMDLEPDINGQAQHQMPPVNGIQSDSGPPRDHVETYHNRMAHNTGREINGHIDNASDMDIVEVELELDNYARISMQQRASALIQESDGPGDAMIDDQTHAHREDPTYSIAPADNDMPPPSAQHVPIEQDSPSQAPPKKSKKSKKRKKQPEQPQIQPGDTLRSATFEGLFNKQAGDERLNGHQEPYHTSHGQQYEAQQDHEHSEYAEQLPTPGQDQPIYISSTQLQPVESPKVTASTTEPTPAAAGFQTGNFRYRPRSFISTYQPRSFFNTARTVTMDNATEPVMPDQANAAPTSAQMPARMPAQTSAQTHAQNPAYQVNDPSAADRQVSDPFDNILQQLRRTCEQQKAQEIDQLTAEKQSLGNQLQHAINAKNALEGHVSTLRDEKERFAASLKEEKTKFESVRGRVMECKKYVDGLQGDLKQFKLDTDRHHQQMKEMLAADDRSAPDLSKHLEDSQRLKDDVAKQCREASSRLSAADHDIANLKDRLKQKTDDLDSEKKLRSDLQAQFNQIENSEVDRRRQMSEDKNAILDKLNEIHTTLKDTDNQQQVTDMLEKTTAAIQGLNTQQDTTVDEVASMKDMVESLTETMTQSVNDRQSEHEEQLSTLQSKITELEAELQLQTAQVTSLQEKLDSAPPPAPSSDERVEATRQEAKAFLAQRQAEHENELKRLSGRPSKDEFTKLKQQAADLKHLADTREQDVINLNTKLENQERKTSTAQRLADDRQQSLDSLNTQFENEKREWGKQLEARPSPQELASREKKRADAQQLADRRQQEIERLNAEVQNEKRTAANVQGLADRRQQDIQKLSEKIASDKRAFEQQLAAQPSADEQSALKGQLSEAQQLTNERQVAIDNINTQLEQEKAKCQRLETRNEEYKISCDAAVAKEKDRCDKQIEALQDELKRIRNELQVKVTEHNEFVAEYHKTWDAEQVKWNFERTGLKQQVKDAHQRIATLTTQQNEPDHRDVTTPVVEESQQEETRITTASSRHSRPIYAAETQAAYDHLDDGLLRDNVSDQGSKYKYQKPQQAPNSSSKRVGTSSTKSSSPAFVESQMSYKPTTYGVHGSSQTQRTPNGRESAKRKASDAGNVIEGYEQERQKRVKANASGRARPSATPSVLGSSQGSRNRMTRSRTIEMAARFAQENTSGSDLTGRR